MSLKHSLQKMAKVGEGLFFFVFVFLGGFVVVV